MASSSESSDRVGAGQEITTGRIGVQEKFEKHLQTLRQRKEKSTKVPFSKREVRIKKDKALMVMTLFAKESDVRAICNEIGIEYVCMNCITHDPGMIEQFVKKFKDGKTREKGCLSKFKNLVIKVVGKEAVEGIKVGGLPRTRLPDPWREVATVIGGILLNNQHLTNLFGPSLRILAAIKYRELVDFANFILKKIERNIIIWQEGKEHEIIYLGILQLIINQALSGTKRKESVEEPLMEATKTLLDVAEGSQEAERSPLLGDEGGKSPSPDFMHESFSIPKVFEGGEDILGQMQDRAVEIETLRRAQEKEDIMAQTEKDFEVRIEKTLDIMNSFEKKLTLEVPAKEQVETRLREMQRLIKVLQNDITDLVIKLRQTEDRLNKVVELGYQLTNCRAPNCVYAMVFKEGLLRFQLKTMINLGAWEEPLENLQYAFIDIHNIYLKKFGGAIIYVEKLRDSVLEWHAKKQQLWNQAAKSIQRRTNELGKDSFLIAREPWRLDVSSNAKYRADAMVNKIKAEGPNWIGTLYYPSLIFQPLVKNIGKSSPAYQSGIWLGAPHNSEARWGKLPGECNLREVMHHDSLA
eukprot:Gb_21471 [translate_table: standard]